MAACSGIAGQGWHLVVALGLYAFLARRFGPSVFGSWTVVLSVLAWFEIFVVAGVVKVATKAISETPDARRPLARAAYAAQMGVALAAFALMEAGASAAAAALGNPSLTLLLRVAAIDIPLFALFMIASAIVLGRHRFERQALAWTVYATAKAVFIAGFVLVGFSVPGALVGNALASLVGFAAVFVPTPPSEATRTRLTELARWMLAAAVPFVTLALIEGVAQSVDLWIVSGVVGDTTLVGYYASATVLAEIPVFLFIGLNRVVFPSVARARANGDGDLAAHYASQAVRLAIIVTVLGVAAMAAVGRQVITLVYSAAYLGAYASVVLLMTAGMGRAIRATCTEVLMAEGRRRAALTILIVTTLIEVALVVAGATRYGIAGAAAGAAASALLAAGWGALLLRGSIGLRPLKTLARSVLAAGTVAFVLSFVAPPLDAAPVILLLETLGWLVLATAAYGARDEAAGGVHRRRPRVGALGIREEGAMRNDGMRRRLTVNADDFGWSRSVNRGIVETHLNGIVTSTSLLVAGTDFEDAVELALRDPDARGGRAPQLLPRNSRLAARDE